MQIRKSSFTGDRPPCQLNPKHPVHRHDCYVRYGDCDDKNPLLVTIFRFLCVGCGHTMSVLSDHLLPYRAVPVPRVEKHFDALANGSPPPVATEKETGCLKRAWTRFNGRVEALLAVLGQLIQAVKPGASALWNQLRQWGNRPWNAPRSNPIWRTGSGRPAWSVRVWRRPRSNCWRAPAVMRQSLYFWWRIAPTPTQLTDSE